VGNSHLLLTSYGIVCLFVFVVVFLFSFLDNSMDAVEVKSHELCVDTVHDLDVGKVSEAGLKAIAQLPHGPGNEMFCTKLNKILLKLEGDPIFSMLELQLNPKETLADLFKVIKGEMSERPNPQVKYCCVCS